MNSAHELQRDAGPVGLQFVNRAALAASTSRVVRRAELEHLAAAESLLQATQEAARQQAAALDTLRQQAFQAGQAQGFEAGKEAWVAQWMRARQANHAQLQQLQGSMLSAVMAAVRHLVGELPAEQRFELLAQQVLLAAAQARRIRLVVAAPEAAAAQRLLERWQQDHPQLLAIEVQTDEALSAGDCLLETDEGAIDGRLAQRLATIEEALREHLQAVADSSRAGAAP